MHGDSSSFWNFLCLIIPSWSRGMWLHSPGAEPEEAQHLGVKGASGPGSPRSRHLLFLLLLRLHPSCLWALWSLLLSCVFLSQLSLACFPSFSLSFSLGLCLCLCCCLSSFPRGQSLACSTFCHEDQENLSNKMQYPLASHFLCNDPPVAGLLSPRDSQPLVDALVHRETGKGSSSAQHLSSLYFLLLP